MKTTIESLIVPTSDTYVDSPLFRNLIEDHLTWLINHANNSVKPVTAHQIEVYDFDWIGLLRELQISPDLHYATIRMNGGKSFTDIPSDLRSLKVPGANVIQNLIMLSRGSKTSI